MAAWLSPRAGVTYRAGMLLDREAEQRELDLLIQRARAGTSGPSCCAVSRGSARPRCSATPLSGLVLCASCAPPGSSRGASWRSAGPRSMPGAATLAPVAADDTQWAGDGGRQNTHAQVSALRPALAR